MKIVTIIILLSVTVVLVLGLIITGGINTAFKEENFKLMKENSSLRKDKRMDEFLNKFINIIRISEKEKDLDEYLYEINNLSEEEAIQKLKKRFKKEKENLEETVYKILSEDLPEGERQKLIEEIRSLKKSPTTQPSTNNGERSKNEIEQHTLS